MKQWTIVFAMILQFVGATSSAQDSDKTCVNVTDAELRATTPLVKVPFADGDLNQAKKYFIQYFDAWNRASEKVRLAHVARGPARKRQAIKNMEIYRDFTMNNYYDPALKIAQTNSSHVGLNAQNPVPPGFELPDTDGFGRNAFLIPFMMNQPGSVHRFEYLCIDGNLVTAGIHYYAPIKGKKFADPLYPEKALIAADAYAVANYVIEGQVIKSLKLTFDAYKFHSDSIAHGISVLPPELEAPYISK